MPLSRDVVEAPWMIWNGRAGQRCCDIWMVKKHFEDHDRDLGTLQKLEHAI